MERQILFNGPLVRAIREGRKTETRRPVKPQPTERPYLGTEGWLRWGRGQKGERCHCPYGIPGDLLWARETWAAFTKPGHEYPHDLEELTCAPLAMREQYGADRGDVVYRADGKNFPDRWRPSIHMPRWASRILLEVTDVSVERVQDIAEEEARAEGVRSCHDPDGCTYETPSYHLSKHQKWARYRAVDAFSDAWDEIYKSKGAGWKRDPWVWVVKFKVLEPTP